MAIFKKDKTEEKKEQESDKTSSIADKKGVSGKNADDKKTHAMNAGGLGEMENVLTRPHITEKASMHAENNVYVFEVSKRANKTLVKNAMKELYKVSPLKVNIVNSPSKNVASKGIKGVKSGKKKALVYLKKGDTIEII